MSADHARRWEHRTHATPTRHWSPNPADLEPHPGPVEGCDRCPKPLVCRECGTALDKSDRPCPLGCGGAA